MYPKIDMLKTGINIKTIVNENIPTIDNLYALSKLLNVSIDDLLCGDKVVEFY